MPIRRDYHDNSLAEFELFGYNPKVYGYPENNKNVKFKGKEIGKVTVDAETLETIFKPNDSDKD